MSSSSSSPPNTDIPPDADPRTPNRHARRPSLFSSILSLAIPPPASPSTSTAASATSLFSPTTTSQSPTSSLGSASSPPAKPDSFNNNEPPKSAFAGLRWPGSHTVPNPALPAQHPASLPSTTTQPQSNPSTHAVPARRASASSAFRRPFELPNYTRVVEEENPTQNQQQQQQQPQQRGRSGSLLSSLSGGGGGNGQVSPQRRKLSPMGERMIRDHPF